MLKFITRNILTGLLAILPVVLTLYLLYWFAITAETALGGIIRLFLPETTYWPGMGMVAALLAVFFPSPGAIVLSAANATGRGPMTSEVSRVALPDLTPSRSVSPHADFSVTALPPDRVVADNGDQSTQLNVFLYRVSHNAALRNTGSTGSPADHNAKTVAPIPRRRAPR